MGVLEKFDLNKVFVPSTSSLILKFPRNHYEKLTGIHQIWSERYLSKGSQPNFKRKII